MVGWGVVVVAAMDVVVCGGVGWGHWPAFRAVLGVGVWIQHSWHHFRWGVVSTKETHPPHQHHTTFPRSALRTVN